MRKGELFAPNETNIGEQKKKCSANSDVNLALMAYVVAHLLNADLSCSHSWDARPHRGVAEDR